MVRDLLLKKQTGIMILILSALVVLCCVGSCMASTIRSCKQSENPPEIPIYKNAVLINQITKERVPARHFYETAYFEAVNTYATASSLEDLFAFYDDVASCRKDGARVNCYGYTNNSGRYFVFIDSVNRDNENVISYTVTIEWWGCSSRTLSIN